MRIEVALEHFRAACPTLQHLNAMGITEHLGRYYLLLLLSELLLMVDKLHSLLPGPLFKFPFQSGVIVVLDMVVSAARQVLGDLGPPVAIHLMQFKDSLVFMDGPFNFLNIRIKMIVPSK